MRRLFPVLVIGLLLAVQACERTESPKEAKEAPPVPNEPTAVAAVPPPAPAPPIDEAAARALFTRWLEAQNAGDFAAYSALYATRMYGEKRAGARLYKFDRKGWLADRERMFKKAIKVSADDLAIQTDALTANLTFTQSFEQGSFHDRGPKRMTLVREQGELRISTELMVASSLAKTSVEAAKDFYFVVQIEGKSYAILEEGAAPSWGTGPASKAMRTEYGAFVVLQETKGLPSEEAALSGKALRVYTAAGAGCETKVSTLRLMAAVIPHFGTVMTWDGTVDESGETVPEDKRVPAKPAAIARQVLGEVDPSHLSLVGEISGCQGVFATSPERKVKVFPANEPDAQAHEAAQKAFSALPAFKRATSDYAKAMSELNEPVQPEWFGTVALRGFGDDAALVAVAAERSGGCADYSDSLTAVFRRTGADLKPVAVGRNTSLPTMLIDLDEDGTYELITGSGDFAGRSLARFVKDEAQTLRAVPVSFHDCGC